jgi:hypothetical protein
MDVDVTQLENGLAGLFQRLFPGHANIREQMRVVGEVAERLALAVPRPSKAPPAPALGECRSPVFLMNSKGMTGHMQGEGSHGQAPRDVKCSA